MKQKAQKASDKPTNTPVSDASVGKSQMKRGLYTLLWFVLWPIVIFVVLLGIILSLQGVEESMAAIPPRLGFFGIVVILAIVCLIFIHVAKRAKRLFFRSGAPVLAGYMWLGIFVGGLIIAIIPDQAISETENAQTASSPVIPELSRDKKIDQTLREIGATNDEINLISTKYINPDKFELDLSHQQGEYGSFINPVTGDFLYGELHVIPGLDEPTEKTVIAHEYLHHVWAAKIGDDTKYRLDSDLIAMYGNDPAMRDYVQEYIDDGILNTNELFAYYCTESSDGYLSGYVLEQCNKYINRSVLTMYR